MPHEGFNPTDTSLLTICLLFSDSNHYLFYSKSVSPGTPLTNTMKIAFQNKTVNTTPYNNIKIQSDDDLTMEFRHYKLNNMDYILYLGSRFKRFDPKNEKDVEEFKENVVLKVARSTEGPFGPYVAHSKVLIHGVAYGFIVKDVDDEKDVLVYGNASGLHLSGILWRDNWPVLVDYERKGRWNRLYQDSGKKY